MGSKKKPIVPPSDLSSEEVVEWRRLTAAAAKMGRAFGPEDADSLALAAKMIVVNRTAYAKMNAEGMVITHKNGIIAQNPVFKTFRESTSMLRAALRDLCMTPASRGFDKGDAEDFKPLRF